MKITTVTIAVIGLVNSTLGIIRYIDSEQHKTKKYLVFIFIWILAFIGGIYATVKLTSSGEYTYASERLLTKEELQKFDSWNLRIIRNEIFARNGYKFKNPQMIKHFGGELWYNLIREVDQTDEYIRDHLLSSIEKQNLQLILDIEKTR